MSSQQASYSSSCRSSSLRIAQKDPILHRAGEEASVSEILKKFSVNYNTRLIREFNSDGVDLLKKMLALEPKDRLSASQALQHPFFNF